jgi:hypothetical protein
MPTRPQRPARGLPHLWPVGVRPVIALGDREYHRLLAEVGKRPDEVLDGHEAIPKENRQALAEDAMLCPGVLGVGGQQVREIEPRGLAALADLPLACPSADLERLVAQGLVLVHVVQEQIDARPLARLVLIVLGLADDDLVLVADRTIRIGPQLRQEQILDGLVDLLEHHAPR